MRNLQKALITVQTRDEFLLRMLLDISMLNLAIYGIIGKWPILTLTYPEHQQAATRVSVRKLFKPVVDSSRINLIDKSLLMSQHITNETPGEQLPCGHFSQVVNERFANSVLAHLRKKDVI